MVRQLYTIGYEGKSIDEFIEQVRSHAVECLIDVREVPLSRKRGFSKTALNEILGQQNVAYVHLRSLGSPKTARRELKESGDYGRFFDEMNRHLAGQEEAIETANEYTRISRCCLLCFEADANKCHRSMVAQEIQKRSRRIQIRHI